ncbi:hypothetical protein AAFF_G00121970 [Aldrovandia affinis]|uniref:Peptidase aspartic putative domain-containing protein n=1 Tax=Aldrovandia affinis TaxID=143900 RepID=A0AAD7R0Z7_9TELE|nr:hypothetical protein AAFF_G00121970 [Aldrovandia affinis]
MQEATCLTGAGENECVLSIIPVKIKSRKSDKHVETYALMDPGSTATFITEDLRKKLNVKGKPTQILLSTMNEDRPERTETHEQLRDIRLEVCGLEDSKFIELPKAYTHGSIPVHTENIPKQSEIRKWPYLSEVRLPEIEADVGLLIGANCSSAMEPWHVINSRNGGPYAVKTAIGWVVNGPIRKELSEKEKPPHCSVNRITVTEIEKLLVQQYNTDFPERNYDDKEEMSQEDKQFMQSVKKTTTFENGHYSIGLPLKNHKLPMPKNRCMAEQRLASLRRKFRKDPGFYEDYKCFMDNVVEKGYAVRVPDDQLNRADARNRELKKQRTWISALKLYLSRALGIQWDTETDAFTYSIKLPDKPMTRRGILAVVNSIYDPLGLLAPVILPAKLLLKDLCKEQSGWDEDISEKHAEDWKGWTEDVTYLSNFQVNRCLKPADFGRTASAQLHHFSDASEYAYGTASYLLLENKQGKKHCSLVMGKSRVASLKQVTIPRLELTAAVVAVKIDKMLHQELQVPLQPSTFWTDSTHGAQIHRQRHCSLQNLRGKQNQRDPRSHQAFPVEVCKNNRKPSGSTQQGPEGQELGTVKNVDRRTKFPAEQRV